MNISFLTATFDLPLHPRDIPRWRSAWSEMAGFEHDRFHNHKPGEQGVIYRYPLVQYRVEGKRAGLIALGKATEDVQRALSVGPCVLTWNREPLEISLEDLQLELEEVRLEENFCEYRLRSYLPFNDQNFSKWKRTTGLLAQVQLLQRMLVGHLLNFATGISWKIPGRFEAEIIRVDKTYSMPLHGVQRPAFDLSFRTNLVLPTGIGLGKGVSHGYGLLMPNGKRPRSNKVLTHSENFS